MKLERRRKALLYLTPGDGWLRAGLALREASMEAARALDLPAEVDEILATAKKYSEGYGVRVLVRDQGTAEAVRALVKVKAAS